MADVKVCDMCGTILKNDEYQELRYKIKAQKKKRLLIFTDEGTAWDKQWTNVDICNSCSMKLFKFK